MKKLLVVAVILLGFSTMAMAQEFARAEVFGGYSFLRCDNTLLGAPGATCRYDGWKAAVAINGNKWLGFVADVTGSYDRSVPAGVSRHVHSFLVGPRFTIRSGRTTTFLQGLFGDSRITPGVYFPYDNSFTMALGGGLDIDVSEKFAVRPIQLEYVGIRSESPVTDNLRMSIGLIYKIGQVK